MSSVLNDNLDKVKRGALSGAMAIEWLYSVTGFSFVLVSCWVGLVILPLRADDWGAAVVVSSTLGVHGNRICIGEATRGDLGCPTYAPSLTTAGDISVTGNLSAAKFLGDGSGLTNLAASNISVTTGASGSLVYRDAYGSLMASAGLSISSTTGSVGIGADAPANLGNSGLFVSGSIRTAENYMITDNKKLSWGGGNTSIVGREGTSSDFLAFKTSGTEALRIVSSGYVGIGTSTPSATLHLYGPTNSISSGLIIGSSDSSAQRLFIGPVGQVSARIRPMVANGQLIIESSNGSRIMSIFSGSNTVGIGLPFSGSTPPSTTLDLAGTLKIADGGEACDTNRLGAIKYDTANFYVCKNTSLGWEPLSTSTSSTTPSIDSGLSGSIVYRDEYGYLKANNTFSISSTTGSVGIGAGAPASVGTNGLYVGGGT